jgi:hypothetical protein
VSEEEATEVSMSLCHRKLYWQDTVLLDEELLTTPWHVVMKSG